MHAEMQMSDLRYPLSAMQQSMVVASSRDPTVGLYVQQVVCTLREPLDAGCLRAAWAQLVARHAVLRSTVQLEPEGLFQTVHEHPSISWKEWDWSELSSDEQERKLDAFLTADRAEGFDFAGDPLQRVALIRRAPAQYQFIWTCHHALIDGHARLLALRELFACYDLCRDRNTYIPPATPRPFVEHVRWLNQQEWRQAESFWRNYLRGFHEPVHLTIEETIRSGITPADAHAKQSLRLSAEFTLELQSFAERNQITINTVVQAAWAILLGRYSGKTDVVFGATRACRRSSVAGADTIIGPLLNTVPVRVSISSDAALLPWLQDLRAQWITLREYEHTPLGQIHAWSDVPKGTALFESILVFERISLNAALQNFGGHWKNRTVEIVQRPDSPLTLFGHATPEVELGIAFDRRRFDPQSISRLLGHLRTLLEGFVRTPHCHLSDLPLLTAEERHRVIEIWNDTAREFPRDACVHHFFEQRVRDDPARVALIQGNHALSYEETNARSNRLARHLRRRGIEPEVLVGVFLERSPEVVIALLAVLKAGGAFVLLDPDSPPQRLQHVLEDARLGAVITRRELANRLPRAGTHLVCLDDDQMAIAGEAEDDLAPCASAENLAYAVYTSGTTGKPKGTLICHRSLVNHTLSAQEKHGITPADRRLQFVSISSDVFVAEVFNYLSAGATLVFGLRSDSTSINDFLHFLDENRITVVGLPSSYWNEWVAALTEGEPIMPRSLRLVISGMEKVQSSSLEIWQRKVGARLQWFNAYGPSETTCTATMFNASVAQPVPRVVPIGKPIANTRIYLFDQDRNLVPVGVPGELYIGGDGVGRGYLNQPELTAAKFVPDPFSSNDKARLYRTGDMGVWLPDGNIAFLGRVDNQIKIRGHRIELEEIEGVLYRVPGIRQCAVTVSGTGAAQWLSAYVVLDPARSPTDAELRGLLAEHLPRYMVPDIFARIDKLPRTSSGKVDRSKLPVTRAVTADPARVLIPPRGTVELHLTKIWEDLLQRERIGIKDNFFDLGGHSLLALRLVDRIEKTFGRRLPLDTLWFQATTIDTLARLLQEAPPTGGNPDLVPIKGGSRRPLFVTHTMGGNLFHYYELARQLEPDQPVVGLQARGVYGDVAPDSTISTIAMRCTDAMRRAQPTGPYLLAGFSSGGLVAFEIARQLSANGDAVAMLGLIDTFAPQARIRERWLRRLTPSPGRSVARELQELLYFSLLHPFALDHWRDLRTVGEAHRWAHWSYRPRPWSGPVEIFLADESDQRSPEPDLGWRRFATGNLRIHRIPDNHGQCMKPPAVVELARKLQACINATRQK